MSREKTNEAARGKWKGLLTYFGIDPKFLEDKHQACPLCHGGKDRFRWDNKDGSGSYYCSGCGAGSGMDLLMKYRGWDFARAAKEVDAWVGNVGTDQIKQERTEAQKRESIRRLLESGVRLAPGTASWIYLERRCGDPSGVLGDLRHHPGLKHSPESPGPFPALLATMRYPDGKGASVHRTYLTPDGCKANVNPVRKIMPGFPLEGSSVRLGPTQERIGIAEGIETAICAGKLFCLPVWSAISANGLICWQPPEGVRSVVIFGDHDASFTGQAAAYDLAKRLRLKGLAVEIEIPPVEGQDWQDVWASSRMQEAG